MSAALSAPHLWAPHLWAAGGVPEVVLGAQSGGRDRLQLAVRPGGHLPHDACRNIDTSGMRRRSLKATRSIKRPHLTSEMPKVKTGRTRRQHFAFPCEPKQISISGGCDLKHQTESSWLLFQQQKQGMVSAPHWSFTFITFPSEASGQ